MSSPGEIDLPADDLLVRARAVMLDALEALADHLDSVVVVGAQAVYMRTGGVEVAIAEATKDSDLALDPRDLGEDPLIEDAMAAAGFIPDPQKRQPGAWISALGIPVDLMVPERLAGPGGANTRGARLPPHGKGTMRRTRGLEAAVVDNTIEHVTALDPNDERSFPVRVAGSSALLVAKLLKVAERVDQPHRLQDKDAHDIYRILRAIPTEELVGGIQRLVNDPVSKECAEDALAAVSELVAPGPHALMAEMAGRAEEGFGEPDVVALSMSLLAAELVAALKPVELG